MLWGYGGGSVCVCVGGGTLIFAYIRKLGQFFKILNFNIIGGGGGGRKMNIFGVMEILWIIYLGQHNSGLFSEAISLHFKGFFRRSKVKNGNTILGSLKVQMFFLVCLIFLIFLGGKQ